MLVSDIINTAFIDIGTITPTETITSAMQTDAYNRLNPILDMLSAEGLTVPTQVEQAFSLQAGVTGYTLGSGGTFSTAGGLRAMKVTAWRAYYSTILHSGGRVLSMPEFGEMAKQALGEQTSIPAIVGADTAYPLINVRVFPPPSYTPGTLELAYWTPLANFATVNDTVNMPQGWLRLLVKLLAKDLHPQWGRPSLAQAVWAAAQEAKAALVEQNAMSAPQNPQPAAPQGQQ
jgi:hypothetical protein